jgi:hypothetical protein
MEGEVVTISEMLLENGHRGLRNVSGPRRTPRARKRKLLAFWALKIMAHLAPLKRGRYFNPHAA